MKITILNRPIGEYKIILRDNATPAENFACDELRSYIYKMTGDSLDICHSGNKGLFVCLSDDENRFDDGFSYYAFDENGISGIKFTAFNGRGIIYSIYDFLEKMGYRFFAVEGVGKGYERGDYMDGEECLFDDSDKVINKDFKVCEKPAFYYRDNYTFACTRHKDYLKFRFNAETWGLHRYKEEWGGGLKFCGAGGHSFSSLVPLSEYGESHPEYFSEINGKRLNKSNGNFLDDPQLCLTNDELVRVVANKMIAMLKENYSDFISLSQSDNHNFCTCEKCRKSYEEYGCFGTLLNFVNKVARKIKKVFPLVKVHTYCYEKTADATEKVKADDNVIVQYCPRICMVHKLNDKNCKPNCDILNKLKTIGKICNEIFIYDYRSFISFPMIMTPDIGNLKENMKCYADANVKGIYSESNTFTIMQPTMEELRNYLYSKIVWNPYMSDEEYNRHINEFLQVFYGKGWKYIREYIDFYDKSATENHVDSFDTFMLDKNNKFIYDDNGLLKVCTIFPKDKEKAILEKLNYLLDCAEKQSSLNNDKYFQRIEIIRTGLIWYYLYHNMDNILENGTAMEREEVINQNENLCERMRIYQMKYVTFIGMTNTTNMFENYTLSPSKWNYCVSRDVPLEAFNRDTFKD